MIIFTESREQCSRMTYKEFQDKVIKTVRSLNHLDLVDSWEKHIIYKSFSESDIHGTSYYGNVFFAEEFQKGNPFVIVYQFSYHEIYKKDDFLLPGFEPATFYCLNGRFYKEEIEALKKFVQCFSVNKSRSFSCTLDDFHEAKLG